MNPQTATITVAVIAAVSSSGVMSLVIYLLQRRDRKKEKQDENSSAQSRMLLGLGHDKIVYLTEKYVKRGAITLKEKRNLEYLCTPYFDLGGNGDARIGYDACERLRIASDDEAEALDAAIKRKEYGLEA